MRATSQASVARHAIATSRYGTRSEVASASAPPPEAATACPAAQVRLESEKAMPWLSCSFWAPAATIAEAGAKIEP